jgi:sugar O-acyltransferase (sialic acid O-acetyltransferase NeuD family)
MQKEIILLGGGGHCKSVIDVIEQEGSFRIKGILDVPEKVGQEIIGYHIIGTEEELAALLKETEHVLITVGQIRSSTIRLRLFEQAKAAGGQLPMIISPRAYVSRHARIGEGSIVMHDACVNSGARVGVNTIINSQALVEHDARIGDHCHISTGAVVNGDCKVRNHVLIGSRASLRQGVSIAEHVLVGMGSVVLHDITEPGIYAGVPTKKIG